MLEQKDLEMIAEIVERIVDRKLQPVKEEMQRVNAKVENVEMTLENETNRNIQIIAEGHSDLVRKLNEALKIKEDEEIIKIRLNRLESELEILKKKIG